VSEENDDMADFVLGNGKAKQLSNKF